MKSQFNRFFYSVVIIAASSCLLAVIQSVCATCYDAIKCNEFDTCNKNGYKCVTIAVSKEFGSANNKAPNGDSESYKCGELLGIQDHPGICDFSVEGGCGGYVPKKSSSCPEKGSGE